MSSLEDMVWMVRLGREGEFRHVANTLYLKRAHDRQLHLNWHNWSAEEKREAWIHHGIGLLESVLPAGDAADRPRLAGAVIDRLVSRDLWRLYDTDDPNFVPDFLAAAEERGLMPPGMIEALAPKRRGLIGWFGSIAGARR
jgi:hypothetical protein